MLPVRRLPVMPAAMRKTELTIPGFVDQPIFDALPASVACGEWVQQSRVAIAFSTAERLSRYFSGAVRAWLTFQRTLPNVLRNLKFPTVSSFDLWTHQSSQNVRAFFISAWVRSVSVLWTYILITVLGVHRGICTVKVKPEWWQHMQCSLCRVPVSLRTAPYVALGALTRPWHPSVRRKAEQTCLGSVNSPKPTLIVVLVWGSVSLQYTLAQQRGFGPSGQRLSRSRLCGLQRKAYDSSITNRCENSPPTISGKPHCVPGTWRAGRIRMR